MNSSKIILSYKNLILFLIFILSCTKEPEIPFSDVRDINKIAESFVILSLATGKFDKDLVDSYFGPDTLKEIAEKLNLSLDTIKLSSERLITNLESIDTSDFDENSILRLRFLKRQLKALISRLNFLEGKISDFDTESLAYYDVIAPVYPLKYYQNILDSLERIIPGNGDLSLRYHNLRNKFIIPEEKIDTVFKTALNHSRQITKHNIELLPENESFIIEYVKDKPWGAYNWFKGNGHSLIQINTELPVFIDRAIDLACHEGYPGHHVFHTLSEDIFYKRNHWVEFSIYLLFSPQALISEGTANYSINLVFKENEKLKFEKNILFPLAGLNPRQYDLYQKIQLYTKRLAFISIETARRYLNSNMTKEQAIEWLMKYQLMDRQRAERSIRFYEKYRSYVINYYMGEELVKNYIESRAAESDNISIWKLFLELITKPTLPSELFKN